MLGPTVSNSHFIRVMLMAWLAAMFFFFVAAQAVPSSHAAPWAGTCGVQADLLVLPDGRIRTGASLGRERDMTLSRPGKGWAKFNGLVAVLQGVSSETVTAPLSRL